MLFYDGYTRECANDRTVCDPSGPRVQHKNGARVRAGAILCHNVYRLLLGAYMPVFARHRWLPLPRPAPPPPIAKPSRAYVRDHD